MTIVIVADFGYVEGGAAKIALDSVRLLHEAGYNVVLFCGSREVDPEIVSLGIKIEKLGMYQLKDNPSKVNAMLTGIWNRVAAARLKDLLAGMDAKSTVVHIHSWTKILSPSIFSVLRKSGFKTFITSHDYFLACPNGAFFDYVHNHVCPYKGGSLKCLLCNCDVRNYIQKVWRWVRHKVVGFEIGHFQSLSVLTISALNDSVLRGSLGDKRQYFRVNNPMPINNDANNSIGGKSDFLFVGRASPEKGLELFASAVTKANVHGVVIGGGYKLESVRSQYPGVEYLGWVPAQEVRHIALSRAAVLVFSSLSYEGAPLSPLEMMAGGIPCIISDVTAAKDYIEDGVTGLLFKSGDVEDLRRKIVQMNDVHFRDHISANIRQRFDIKNWSEGNYIKHLNEVYAH